MSFCVFNIETSPNFELTIVVKDHLLVQRNFESANESLVPISKDLPFVLQTLQYLPQVSEKYGEQGHISKLNPDVAILHQFHFQPTSVQLQPCCEQQQGVSLLLTVVLHASSQRSRTCLKLYKKSSSCIQHYYLVYNTRCLWRKHFISESCKFSEKKKLDDKIKSFLHGEVFPKKRQFPQFVSQFIVTDFYIYPSRYKSSKMEHILVFDLFLSFYRLMLHVSMHLVTFKTYFSHLLSFILIHLSHFIKFYLLFTNLKFKEKKEFFFLDVLHYYNSE